VKQPAFRAPGTPVAAPAIARAFRRRIQEECRMTTLTQSTERADGALRARLEARLGELRAKLAGELVPAPDETLAAAAGEVRDAGDEAVVIERTDVRTALMQRDAREVGELQSALIRLDDGQYGVCAECGLDIETGRLRALPTALRCSGCQEAHEHRSALSPGR
jgi:RNA polymerase-binding transcription factor DksA